MTDRIKESIIQRQHDIWDAIVAKDFDRLSQLYPETMQFRHVDGKRQTREEYFDYIRTGTFRYYNFKAISEDVMLIDENHAILHSIATTDARIYGFRKVWRMDFELPYVKVNNQWQPDNM